MSIPRTDSHHPTPRAIAQPSSHAQRSLDGVALFFVAVRRRPLRRSAWLLVEYGMFASAIVLALVMLALRVPLRVIDRAFGLRLREHVIAFIARLSPG